MNMQNPDQNIQLTLSLSEVNQILTALGEQSYSQVFQLIGKIHQQAEVLVNDNQALAEPPAAASNNTSDREENTE
jgi:hypothetical protein